MGDLDAPHWIETGRGERALVFLHGVSGGAAGVIDMLAAGLVLLGLALQAPTWLVAVKLLLIFVFILFTSPTSTHALARAALNGGVKPLLADPTPSSEGEPPSKS